MKQRIEGIVSDDFPAICVEGHEPVLTIDDLANKLKKELPTDDVLARDFVVAVRKLSKNIEFSAAYPTKRCVLDSDASGPGFERHYMYARLIIGAEVVETLDDDRTTSRVDLRREMNNVVDGEARIMAERIAAFRAYNHLHDADTVVIRSVGTPMQYLRSRNDDTFLRVCADADAYYVRFGGYFFVTPPGTQVKP